MCARGEVSGSNKRKVALWIVLLLPHADHHHLPPYPGSRSQVFFLFLLNHHLFLFHCGFSASRPRNRAYLSLRSCKQSNSKLPAIVTHGATVTTEPGEALRIAEEEGVKRIGRREKRSVIRFEVLTEERRCQRV